MAYVAPVAHSPCDQSGVRRARKMRCERRSNASSRLRTRMTSRRWSHLLLNSPDFLWITRGTPVWGSDPALKRFTALYAGTWRLDPEASSLKITMLGNSAAQIYVPIMFTIGAPGQSAQATQLLINLVLVKMPDGWKVSSILCRYQRLLNNFIYVACEQLRRLGSCGWRVSLVYAYRNPKNERIRPTTTTRPTR